MVHGGFDPRSGTGFSQSEVGEACFEKAIVHPAMGDLPQEGEKLSAAEADAISEAYAEVLVRTIMAACSPYIVKALRSHAHGGDPRTPYDNEETEEEAREVDNLCNTAKKAFLEHSRDAPARGFYIYLKMRRK
jgi:hypothetical protein